MMRALIASAACIVVLAVAVPAGIVLFRDASQRALLEANQDKIAALVSVQRLTPGQLQLASERCTATGLRLWQAMQGSIPGPQDGYVVSGFKNSGAISDVKLVKDSADGVVVLHVRLLQVGNEWKFEDIFLDSVAGREAQFWLSWAQEHPVLASLKLAQPEIKAAYAEVKAGLKETAGVVHDVAAIMSFLK